VHAKVLTEHNPETEREARLVTINATYDEESRQVKVSAELVSCTETKKLAISYNVIILAELPNY
jgi:hypothetical protein